MRLIDADAVITAIAEEYKYEAELEHPYASDDLEDYKADARLLLEGIPSIDLVTCGECRKYKVCCRPCCVNVLSYCSDGIRSKEREGE